MQAIILNGFGFVGRTVHMYPECFIERPVERLLGKGIKAEYINHGVLGGCLELSPCIKNYKKTKS